MVDFISTLSKHIEKGATLREVFGSKQ